MLDRTRTLWEKQDGAVGDRRPLYAAVAEAVEAATVLYPGSYVDLAPSWSWPSVTYVDVDRRANQFLHRRFLVPKRPVEITRASLHQSGRGVAYTRSPFAYLFERVA